MYLENLSDKLKRKVQQTFFIKGKNNTSWGGFFKLCIHSIWSDLIGDWNLFFVKLFLLPAVSPLATNKKTQKNIKSF